MADFKGSTLHLGPHAIRCGHVYELLGMPTTGKTELCRSFIASALAEGRLRSAPAGRTVAERGDIWWISSDADVRSSILRVRELLGERWGIKDEAQADALLSRLRCFQCFGYHPLTTLLKKSSFAAALLKKSPFDITSTEASSLDVELTMRIFSFLPLEAWKATARRTKRRLSDQSWKSCSWKQHWMIPSRAADKTTRVRPAKRVMMQQPLTAESEDHHVLPLIPLRPP
jgi:hypothetical protein